MKTNKRIKVIGKVQGVFFRKSTQEKARELDVSGWVKNEPDGSVLAELEGHRHAVMAMEAWLKQGPEKAEVDNLIIQDGEEQGHTSFEIIR
ncbi:acylphosphatase [Litoribacter ruber]|uniref:Acylphosphatase n=1 Tax=Litoribacter ruber TaxID=702568 RepID=A0AAP2CHR6_9BACT|nr:MULTISPECIES: acylphosphatase [Litoribacter]MBS9524387.1 acylphosphatase [Litoribacter alkaliphilus]MBT0809814.1 acylphosphatase [Litoribacter ruber]